MTPLLPKVVRDTPDVDSYGNRYNATYKVLCWVHGPVVEQATFDQAREHEADHHNCARR